MINGIIFIVWQTSQRGVFMKKLLDSKFLFIVALSLVGLILLGLGAFYLYRPSDTSFLRSGYVLNPLSASVEI